MYAAEDAAEEAEPVDDCDMADIADEAEVEEEDEEEQDFSELTKVQTDLRLSCDCCCCCCYCSTPTSVRCMPAKPRRPIVLRSSRLSVEFSLDLYSSLKRWRSGGTCLRVS